MSHLKDNNTTYLSHLLFAGKIGLTLLFVSMLFLLHAVFPIRNVPEKWNLKKMCIKFSLWDEEVEKKKEKEN